MTDSNSPEPDWYPDPSGKYQYRYWNGTAWTEHVSTDGEVHEDPPPAAANGLAESGVETSEDASQPKDDELENGDVNRAANATAKVVPEVQAWLDDVADQVTPRLDRIAPKWHERDESDAASACAYGLLIGHLASLHPHMREALSAVVEVHTSFANLEAGSRLEVLEKIAHDDAQVAAWLGPLIGNEDVDEVQKLFD